MQAYLHQNRDLKTSLDDSLDEFVSEQYKQLSSDEGAVYVHRADIERVKNLELSPTGTWVRDNDDVRAEGETRVYGIYRSKKRTAMIYFPPDTAQKIQNLWCLFFIGERLVERIPVGSGLWISLPGIWEMH